MNVSTYYAEGWYNVTHNVVVCFDCWLGIGSSERHVEIDEDTSLSFWSVFASKQNVVQRNISV